MLLGGKAESEEVTLRRLRASAWAEGHKVRRDGRARARRVFMADETLGFDVGQCRFRFCFVKYKRGL